MRRKKLLRQVAAAAVALSMAVSLSAPAFAAVVTFDLSDGGLVITANNDGITVERDNGASSECSIDDEIVITGTYKPAGEATLTAEEDQPVTPAKAPAKASVKEETSEETPKETSGTENAPASVKKQEQENTETENKDNNSDPADEEKKKQNAPANGELKASTDERQETNTEDEGQPKPKTEANASAEATASASDDTSDNDSNEPRRASAYEDRSGNWEKDSYTSGLRAGIVQIINNTAKKIKVSLSGAHIDLPGEAGTLSRGQAAIDVQGTGDVELKFSGSNTLTGSGRSAGIQKNDDVSTGTLTITADNKSDTLDVKVDKGALGQDNQGAAIGGHGRKTYDKYGGYGTNNIVIEGNGTVNTNAQIGSGFQGGAATGIVIRGNAVVNVGSGGIGGTGFWNPPEKEIGTTDVAITENANVTVKNGTIGSGVLRGEWCGGAEINISGNAEVNVQGGDNAAAIGSGERGNANVTITGSAKVTAVQKSESEWYGSGAGIGGGANGWGVVTIGGKAQVKATGSAEKHGDSGAYGAGAAIGDGGTTSDDSNYPVQNSRNQFVTASDIRNGAKVEMTNIGPSGPNTETQIYEINKWVTKCSHLEKYVVDSIDPTCTKPGSKTYRCSSCDATLTEEIPVDPNRHSWGKPVTVPPTCVAGGYTEYECSVCHATKRDEKTEPTGVHTYTKPVKTVAPTYTERGYTVYKCQNCDATEQRDWVPMLERESTNGAPNYTVTGAETYETSVVDGRYIIAVPSEDAVLNAVLGDLRAIKAQGADVVVFRTWSRESSLVIDEMLAMGTDVTPFVLVHNGGEAQLTINGAAHNELIH